MSKFNGILMLALVNAVDQPIARERWFQNQAILLPLSLSIKLSDLFSQHLYLPSKIHYFDRYNWWMAILYFGPEWVNDQNRLIKISQRNWLFRIGWSAICPPPCLAICPFPTPPNHIFLCSLEKNCMYDKNNPFLFKKFSPPFFFLHPFFFRPPRKSENRLK